jgi:hypothetical protein
LFNPREIPVVLAVDKLQHGIIVKRDVQRIGGGLIGVFQRGITHAVILIA